MRWRNKYNAKKTACKHNHLHDSKREAARCDELYLLLKGKQIGEIEQQPKFVLLPGFSFEGKKIRPITYKADFRYYDNESDKMTIEDCKGMKTEVYRIKKKLLLAQLANQKHITFKES